ncbi:nischarin-like isoform X2 [Xenia sp. Carnegie-2017]|uniref:nischarin-like isoform X2 n=1 Tax=Xenia sp. Carnegie-2017 TaxID=2897299 RepID=UPI001F03719B|nr:nischarin-like isoform X2 [Xenia sp. Carnegie-2017]
MASLQSFLPPAGGTVWRNERRSPRLSSSSLSGDNEISRTRIKHIVIREVWKRERPSPYALYKIDVMTQSNHWFILRRYREFNTLHNNLVKKFNIPQDMLPAKKVFTNMSLPHLEKRRNELEHYLQRLINSHHDIAESLELFHFLNVQSHDVLCVTRQLAQVLTNEGPRILSSESSFTFSPTQMYCITRQLQMPHVNVEHSDSSLSDEAVVDLGNLYSFVQELQNLCVTGMARSSSICQELIVNQAFDISLFKSLKKLQIEKCHVGVINGLYRIQKQLTHVTIKECLKSMKDFLVDAATQKRSMKQGNSNVESWRIMSTSKLTDNRIVVRPWILLTHINMSHNNISSFDHSLKVLPSLEQLDLSYNNFVHLNLEQLSSSTLTFLNLSYNQIHYVSSTSRDLRNLKSLLLFNNKLQNLDGLDCLRGLVELDVRSNDVAHVTEVAKVSSLFHLRILALAGNPCVSSKSHRIQIFSHFKARELILDGVKITDGEKAKVKLMCNKLTQPEESQHSVVSDNFDDKLRKKCHTSYTDDDQDSGFGGNYAGSVDDGGLMFDWSCFDNKKTQFPSLVPAQSTSFDVEEGSSTANNLTEQIDDSDERAARSQEGLHSRHYNVSGIADQTAEIQPGIENVDFRNESIKEDTSHNPTLSDDNG